MRFLTRSREQAIRADERERVEQVLDERLMLAQERRDAKALESEAAGGWELPKPPVQEAHHAEILSNYERAVAAESRALAAEQAASDHLRECLETLERAGEAKRAAGARLRAVAEGRV